MILVVENIEDDVEVYMDVEDSHPRNLDLYRSIARSKPNYEVSDLSVVEGEVDAFEVLDTATDEVLVRLSLKEEQDAIL